MKKASILAKGSVWLVVLVSVMFSSCWTVLGTGAGALVGGIIGVNSPDIEKSYQDNDGFSLTEEEKRAMQQRNMERTVPYLLIGAASGAAIGLVLDLIRIEKNRKEAKRAEEAQLAREEAAARWEAEAPAREEAQKAEQARIEAERARIAAEKEAEQARIAAAKKAEQARIAAAEEAERAKKEAARKEAAKKFVYLHPNLDPIDAPPKFRKADLFDAVAAAEKLNISETSSMYGDYTTSTPFIDFVSELIFVRQDVTDITFRNPVGDVTQTMKIDSRSGLTAGQRVRVYYEVYRIKDWRVAAIEKL